MSAIRLRRSGARNGSSRRSPRSPSTRGERRRVQLSLDGRDFSFWSASARRWRIEAGRFDIAVGASSRDIRLTASVDLAGDGFRPPLEATSTLQEWLDDPDGGDVLRESFSAGDGGLGA